MQLATDVHTKLQDRSEEAGTEISLEGLGYALFGAPDQHMAVRALLLCQKAYLPPQSLPGGNFDPSATKKHYHDTSEDTVRNAIRCYLRRHNAVAKDLADAAQRVNVLKGLNWYTFTRDDNLGLGATPVCYNAVKLWLFKAGFASIRWLVRNEVDNMMPHTANAVLGNGTVITVDQLPWLPAGRIFNFHDPNMQAVCHWGVSIGNGYAIATNTTQQWPGTEIKVHFKSGNSVCGKFLLNEAYVVCKLKYARNINAAMPITIRDIDPAQVPNLC